MFQKASFKGRASMSEVTMIGIELAKRVFQLHGACANGTVIFHKKLTRVQLLAFMSQRSACVVAMEACATAHSWGRDFAAWLGLVPRQNSTGGKSRLGKTSNPLGTMPRMTLTGNGWVSATFAGC
jgi:transposase